MVIGCSVDNEQNPDLIEVLEIVEDKSTPHPLSCALNIEAWKYNPVINAVEMNVTRTVDSRLIKTDSLCYWIDKNDWYSEIPMEEGDIEYYLEMSLKDIDTNKFTVKVKNDEFLIGVYLLPNKKMNTSKITWEGPKMKKIWTIQSDSIKIDFPTDLDRIRRNFKTYKMFDGSEKCNIDYMDNSVDSIPIEIMSKSIINRFKRAIKKAHSNG